jgi:hypothetical protein
MIILDTMLPILINVIDQIKHLARKGLSPQQIRKRLNQVMLKRQVPKLKVNR